MLANNADQFAQYIEQKNRQYGKPFLLFIDETQVLSEENCWGKCIDYFYDAGVKVILMTACAERSDKTKIPGFEYKESESYTLKVAKLNKDKSTEELNHIEIYELTNSKVSIIPNYHYTFNRAWKAGYLCRMRKHLINVEIELENDSGDKELTSLKDLVPTKAKKLLGHICRNESLMKKCIEKASELLGQRR